MKLNIFAHINYIIIAFCCFCCSERCSFMLHFTRIKTKIILLYYVTVSLFIYLRPKIDV
jgi:hypothetical protein